MRIILVSLLMAGLAVAQIDPSGFDEILANWSNAAPAGFSLRLERLSEPVHREGQLVLLRVLWETPHKAVGPNAPIPEVRYEFAGFLISPPLESCGNLAQPCLSADVPSSDIMLRLGNLRRWSLETGLNAYIPRLEAGSYRVAAVMRKTLLVAAGSDGYVYDYPAITSIYKSADEPEYLVSNAIEFDVQPASEEWVREMIRSARDTLLSTFYWDAPSQHAAQQIAALDHPEARLVALELFRLPHQRSLLQGLVRDVSPGQACDLMRSRLAVPEQPLHLNYATFMAELCARAEHPLPQELADAPADDPRRREWAERTKAFEALVTSEVMALVAARAAAAAEEESPDVWSLRREVLDYGTSLLDTLERTEELPDFVRRIAGRAVAELLDASIPDTRLLLTDHWPLLREADPEPALRAIIEDLSGPDISAYPPNDAPSWTEVRQIAIRRLHELDRSAARPVMLNELANFRPTISGFQDLLPTEVVPPMDDALFDLMRREPGHPSFSSFLMAHYLSPEAAGRLKQLIGPKWNSCHPEWLNYFSRTDPDYAESILKRTPWEMNKPVDHCGSHWIATVPRFGGVHGPFEDYLIAHLQHEGVPIKGSAALVLGQYGSTRALQPIWDAYRLFHEYWKDDKPRLESPNYLEGRRLERQFRAAIAQGRAWFADEAKLRELEALCISEACLHDSRVDLAHWERRPFRIELRLGTEPESRMRREWQGTVGHYRELDGLGAVKNKLSQFPAGTEFSLTVYGPARDREQAAAELHEFAAEIGLVLNP